MNKIKLVKEYTYMSICDIDFNVLIDFDYDNEVLLYSLGFEDHNYCGGGFLINYAKSLDEETIYEEIKAFMLNHVQSEVSCFIEENDYNDWKVEVIENGLKLLKKSTKQWATWNIYDYDEDYAIIKSKLIKFLKWNNQ